MIPGSVEAKSWLSIGLLAMASVVFASGDHANPYLKNNHGNYPTQVYWGDTHLHTSYSVDANGFGNQSLGPDEAYRFARGDPVVLDNGLEARLRRPLDFLVVSDHAEYLGLLPMLDAEDPALLSTEMGQHLYRLSQSGKRLEVFLQTVAVSSETGEKLIDDEEFERNVWREYIGFADKYNQPGRFTAFIGYEWTTSTSGDNLHRNVIFRDGAELAGKILPFSALDSFRPEDLWAFLADYESQYGGRALAIPHNPNISGGLMFGLQDSEGKPFTGDYALRRSRWEPLLEVTQAKGDSETHPFLSPDDRFADYERWDKKNFAGKPHEDWMFRHEYARSALNLGLAEEERTGANPFKFGMAGGSDFHTTLSAVSESYFWGPLWQHLPGPERSQPVAKDRSEEKFVLPSVNNVASGRTAVWARENTRESLFAAMQRRETYATTGPRIMLRFFGAWNFDRNDADRPDYIEIGYRKGVPMGGDLAAAPDGSAPRFIIVAARDPMGANLERVQIIKGWLGDDGKLREKVWDVALSDGRKIKDRTVAPIKSTVDVKTASYTNTVGDAELSTVWRDPEFDAGQRAFYYVRALEIFTPRWTTYDTVYYGTRLPRDVPAEVQERAYSSPIWYTP